MKIQKVELEELEFVEVDGEYESRSINKEAFPAFLTNASLKKGKDEGYIEGSLLSELFKMSQLDKSADEDGKLSSESAGLIDEDKVLKVIYLALLGANKNFKYSYHEFIERYNNPLEKSLEIYAKLIESTISDNKNQFAQELKKATGTSKKK